MSKINYQLTKRTSKSGGRNNTGQITVRHRGGGHKNKIRSLNLPLTSGFYNIVKTLYNPASSSPLFLLRKKNTNEFYYTPASIGIKNLSDPFTFLSSFTSFLPHEQTAGTRLPLSAFPIGSLVHNIELKKGDGGKIARAAGQGAQLLRLTEYWAILKLSNKKIITLPSTAQATLGITQGEKEKLYKAGQLRWQGKRPWVSGEAMNAVDHPQGGRTKGGRIPRTQWGKLAKGVPTASKHKSLIA